MKILWLHNYFHDEDDKKVEITEEVYQQLLPFVDDLRRGNSNKNYPDEIDDWWKEWDEKGIPVLKTAEFHFDIEVAIC